jgi:hypothetical protein
MAPPDDESRGSSEVPGSGKSRLGSFVVNTSFSAPDEDRFRISLSPLIG